MVIKLIFFIQIIIVNLTLIFTKLFVRPNNYLWVVGVSETAQNLYKLGKVIKPCVTVSLSRRQKQYNYTYDFNLGFISNNAVRLIVRFFYGPILLGYLSNKATHFFYISGIGFLVDIEEEWRFLKGKSKKIACMFIGSDIRSPKLVRKYLKKQKIDGFIDYQNNQNRSIFTNEFDNKRKFLSKIVDEYADIIFNFKYDQLTYIKKQTYPWPYVYDENHFYYNENKFDKISRIKILHAPSSPFIKGTPLVRAAIKKLEAEGYIFEYIELQDVPNNKVISELRNTHIVLNQFYGYDISLGLFAIEAMANHNALLMSYEPSLVREYNIDLDGFENCCLNTKYWQVYEHLKYLLDNPEKIKFYADNGYIFCKKHYTYEAASKYYNSLFLKNNII